MICLILTYGAPAHPEADGNLQRYTKLIAEWIFQNRETTDDPIELVMFGGCTNPAHPNMSESEAIMQVLPAQIERRLRHLKHVTFRANDQSALDLWDSLKKFRDFLAHNNGDERHRAVIFCENHRKVRVQYLAEHILPEHKLTIVPVNFDERRYTKADHLARTLELATSILSVNIPGFYEQVERRRRLRKIGRAGDE